MSRRKFLGGPSAGVLVLFGVVLASGACERRAEEQPPAEEAPEAAAPAPAPAPAPTLTDAEIAHVAVTANSIDSAMAELAKTKTQNPEVRSFAETMITDHSAVNRQATQLAQRLNVTPMDNDVSRQLQQGADQARRELSAKSGAEFDRAYIDREVTYHQAVLDALDKTLIPQAQNAELKALLEQVRPAVAAHLERARQLQSRLAAPAAT